MKKNFIVDQAIYVNIKNNCYDLHNDYAFIACNFAPSKSLIYLTWLRLDRKWVKASYPNKIVIVFHDILFFYISNALMTEKVTTIQEIGYKDPDDKDLDWLNDERNFTANSQIIFRFENDEFIRVGAGIAEAKEGDDF